MDSDEKSKNKKNKPRDFSGGPAVRTLLFNAGDMGSIPSQGAKILHALQPKKNPNIKKKQYCNKFNKKDFKNVNIKKKKEKRL